MFKTIQLKDVTDTGNVYVVVDTDFEEDVTFYVEPYVGVNLSFKALIIYCLIKVYSKRDVNLPRTIAQAITVLSKNLSNTEAFAQFVCDFRINGRMYLDKEMGHNWLKTIFPHVKKILIETHAML